MVSGGVVLACTGSGDRLLVRTLALDFLFVGPVASE